MEDIWTGTPGEAPKPSGGRTLRVDNIEPLDRQADVTKRLSVPPILREALFGDINEAPASTFAILDAAKIPNLPEILETSGLEYACLYQGAAFDELASVAPWIVKLDETSDFTRALFTETEPDVDWEYWSRDPGIFVRSTAPLDALRGHFRKFTKVRMANMPPEAPNAQQFFRFYEPDEATHYFEAINDWPDRTAQFYRLATGQKILAFVTISSVAKTLHMFTPGPMPETSPGAFIFEPRDAEVFRSARRPRFRKELYDWLLRLDEHRFKPFSEQQLYAVVDHGLREGDAYDFTFKEEYVYLLYMMSFLGGWFHKSGRMPELVRILEEDGRARTPNLRKAFPKTFSNLYGQARETFAGWAVLFGRMEAHLKKNGGWGRFTPARARQLVGAGTKHLGDADRARLEEFFTRIEMDCDRRKIASPSSRGIVVLLSYMIGHSFFSDPFYPWAVEKKLEADSLDAALPEIGNYAMKRGRLMMAEFQKGAA